ncbi:MAG: 50S ribosomal protein L29 [Candidatus Magasanikbacteria bacterium RIFOXYC2_FULL_42_28]|uniref:Large ribosomal subunit protein uL29 n=1 Tax=Candidatus Magasanikbacteria bacterium RIFOXYC2_FULL_42_28 TaxID=1798704 RepID=A0A1F6NU75_9BACT|nr:MAG: 50S ribosomal protein L29 [Candidatus Magasanikbacteria bacterium RIFOXYC2_FULL_42_28]
MDFEELKNKSVKDLQDLLSDLGAQARGLRFRALSRELKQVHRVAEVRKTIARIKTLLKQK